MAVGDFTRINTNVGALNALNSLKMVNSKMGLHQLRLATGRRITEAADDPAGLTIATKFNYRSSGLGVALDNIGDAKNLLAVAEGGLQKINDILAVMRDKALQAASDSLGSAEREAIATQLSSFATQITNIVNETKWNGETLIAAAGSKTFQTGADAAETTTWSVTQAYDATTLNVTMGSSSRAASLQSGGGASFASVATDSPATGAAELSSMRYKAVMVSGTEMRLYDQYGNAVLIGADASGNAVDTTAEITQYVQTVTVAASTTVNTGKGLTITLGGTLTAGHEAYVDYTAQGGSVSSAANATQYLSRVTSAIDTVSEALAGVGALSARLSFKEETLTVARTNTEAAFSRIMNADMAYEQVEATKLQILQQTATAMLAQANVGPQSILSLFR